jgi:hypothetical protein
MEGGARTAWMVGIGLGLVAGLIAAASGLVSGFCCLLQFAQMLIPIGAGFLAGGVAAGMAPWATLEPGNSAAAAGAGIGLRAGGLASVIAAVVGLLLSMALPLVTNLIVVFANEDIVAGLLAAVGGLAFQFLWAAMFALGGALVGVMLGVAMGAIVGLVMGPKE